MKTNILLPKKIRVGFQKRDDCFTKQLAYVIYYDEKGKLRKEKSWESWRDKKIEPQEFDNEPISGFVLNKKVGGYKSDWNFRQAYCRIFDPRGFEFEVTVPNLLYILENTNSIKGKGLEGEFVYCWDGVDLVLLPTSAPEYEKIRSFTEMVTDKEKITKKNIVLGGTYKTNKDEEWVYLGFFDEWGRDYSNYRYDSYDEAFKCKGKRHYFYHDKSFVTISSLSKLVKTVSPEPVSNYAYLIEKLERQTMYSPIDPTKDKYVDATEENLKKLFNNDRYSYWGKSAEVYFNVDGLNVRGTIIKKNDGNFYLGDVYRHPAECQKTDYWGRDEEIDSINKRFNEEALTDPRYNYGHLKEPWTLEELINRFKFKIRKRYLVNGKEYK